MNKYNTLGRRFVAALIDGIILYPLIFIEETTNDLADKSLFSIGIFISSFLYILYFIVLHAKYGQTLGKKLTNIKVIDIAEISVIGFKRATMRELPWIIASGLSFLYLITSFFLFKNADLNTLKENYNDLSSIISLSWLVIELITMFTNSKRRAIHDLLAKAVVIKTKN